MKLGETGKAVIAAALAPLTLIVTVPSLYWIVQLIKGEPLTFGIAGIGFIGLIFGYAGILIFGAPLYLCLKALCHWPPWSFLLAFFAAAFAALVTPPILESTTNWRMALSELSLIFTYPWDMWFNLASLAGGLTGIAFWLILRYAGLFSDRGQNIP